MARILVVDDRETNREFLATLLGYRKHHILQAADGREALALTRAEHPDLIISDILMPTMDGYELVRQLRADPTVAQTPVIFTTAHYLDREARALATACGVPHIMPKPCEAETVLGIVEAALTHTPAAPATPAAPDATFEREHLRLVTDKLREKTDELHGVNAKLTALIEISQQLALERDPQRLFREFTRAARQIIGARHALVARSDPQRGSRIEFFASGLEVPASPQGSPGEATEILDRLMAFPGTHRCHATAASIGGLPRGHPNVRSMLASSIVSLARIYGWVCVTEKIGFDAFSEDDEHVLGILGAQLGRIYENGRLYLDLKLRTAELEREVVEHSQAEAALADRARATALAAEIGGTLTRGAALPAMLEECAAAVVRQLDAASVSIWTLGGAAGLLEQQARAGTAALCADASPLVRIGERLIGTIAAERRPMLINHVVGDARLVDQAWARREGIVAFTGYPLLVEDQLVGAIALFARQPLDQLAVEAVGAVADEIALGVQRKRAELEVEQNERRFRSLTVNASDLVLVLDAQGVVRYASPSHERVLGRKPENLIGSDAFDLLHPEDCERARESFAATATTAGRSVTVEYRGRCADGSWRVLEGIGTNLLDDPSVCGIVINSWDVTNRKHAEQRTAALLEVAQDLAGSIDLEDMLERVQRRAMAMLPCDAVGTFALEESGTLFRLIAELGMWDALLSVAAGSDLRRGGIFGGLTADGETAVINDFAEFPDALRTLAQQCGIGALIAAPLHAHGRQLGALVAFRTLDRPPFASDQVELCSGIAKQLAVAMDARELHRAQQEEAAVSRGLARVGKELIAALGQPGLLERLCQITTEVLECDVSATMLRQADGTWIPVATAGWEPEEREAVLAVAVPPVAMEVLLPQLERGEVVAIQLGAQPLGADVWCHVETLLVVALTNGGRVIGVHTAGYYRRAPQLTAVQRRIGEGLANLASLALDNVRLIEHLDRANRLKSDFVSTMSHELRTPLNIIMGYSELLISGEFGHLTPQQGDTLTLIDGQAEQLLELVNATLDVSRLESGHAPLDLADVEATDMLAEIRHDMRRAEPKETVQLHWPPPSEGIRLYTDKTKLKVVLKNLIDNAVKFTAEGRVDIDVERTADGVTFTVADTGIGIPPESLETIFESFRQLEPSMTRHYGGVGLGLYLARRLAEMLGGSIAVHSEVGRGTTFRVSIPSAPGIAT